MLYWHSVESIREMSPHATCYGKLIDQPVEPLWTDLGLQSRTGVVHMSWFPCKKKKNLCWQEMFHRILPPPKSWHKRKKSTITPFLTNSVRVLPRGSTLNDVRQVAGQGTVARFVKDTGRWHAAPRSERGLSANNGLAWLWLAGGQQRSWRQQSWVWNLGG